MSGTFKIADPTKKAEAMVGVKADLSSQFGVDAIRFKLKRQVEAIRDPAKFIEDKSTNLQEIMDVIGDNYGTRMTELLKVGHSFETANKTATAIAKEEFETAKDIHDQMYPMELYTQALSKAALKTKAGEPGLVTPL